MTETRAPSGGWRRARVASVEHPSPRAVVLRLDVPDRIDHVPGQHYVIRLTAPDGYVAQRSYSVASPPSDPQLEFYVERLEDGEVSMFLADVVEPGDDLDVRGPIGGWFVWDGSVDSVGIAGGSGAVPLVAMLRHARDVGAEKRLRIAVSARTLTDLPYAQEILDAGGFVALTREPRAERTAARLTAAEIAALVRGGEVCYVCGSAVFADAATDLLLAADVAESQIRVERFGPSG